MIQEHEKQTHELTLYEIEKILPRVLLGLKTKIGKKYAVTNHHVVKQFRLHNYKISEPRFRKIIQYIRVNGLIPGLVSNKKGYFVATKKSEIERYVKSLDERINAITTTRDSLYHQMNQMFIEVDEKPFD